MSRRIQKAVESSIRETRVVKTKGRKSKEKARKRKGKVTKE